MQTITLSSLKKEFEKRDISLTEKMIEQFLRLYEMLVQYNDEYDLTRLRTTRDIIEKHFIDSLYFTRYIEMPASLVDIGTGPGFPGIPLKIAFPETEIILAEPRHRRVTFMEMVIKELQLENVTVYPHKVTDKSFFEVEGVITRALEDADGTLTRVRHFLPAGGKVLFMKGPGAEDDLANLSEKNRTLYSLDQDRGYTLPGSEHHRRLLVFTKMSDTPEKIFPIMRNIDETEGHAITSPDNKTYRALKKLTTTEGIRKNHQTLAAGHRIVSDLFKSHGGEVHTCIIRDGYREKNPEMLQNFEKMKDAGKLLVLKKSLFNDLDLYGTGGPLVSIDAPELPPWDEKDCDGVTLLIPFQDPSNVGSCIRSAAGFGVNRIVILREAATPWHPRSVRSSSGTVFSAPLYRGPSIRNFLERQMPVPLVALDRGGAGLEGFNFPPSFSLLPGMEGPGLPEELRASAVSIPLEETVESLNAAVAASIALFEWRRQKNSR